MGFLDDLSGFVGKEISLGGKIIAPSFPTFQGAVFGIRKAPEIVSGTQKVLSKAGGDGGGGILSPTLAPSFNFDPSFGDLPLSNVSPTFGDLPFSEFAPTFNPSVALAPALTVAPILDLRRTETVGQKTQTGLPAVPLLLVAAGIFIFTRKKGKK